MRQRRILCIVVSAVFVVSCGGTPSPQPDSSKSPAAPDSTQPSQPSQPEPSHPEPSQPEPSEQLPVGSQPIEPEMIQRMLKPWTGDYDQMVERRAIRAVVPYGKTSYFIDGGTQRGISYDVLTELENVINEQVGDRARRVQIAIIPVGRDRLIPYLKEGRADIALGNITVSEGRKQHVNFTTPVLTNVSQILVTGPTAPPVSSIDDLSGKQVYVRRSGTKFENVTRLSEGFKKAGKAPITIVPVDDNLEDEDLLELVNAGAIGMVVIDDHIAKVWAEAFPDITPHPELAIATGGEIAWAVRKDCPKLTEVLNGFIATHGIGTAFGNMVYAKYFKNTKWVKNAVSADEIGKLKAAAELFKKYGAEYGFDWLMVAAQAYQESGIDQSVRSPVGAVGVMQVLPSTAAGKPIGITGIDTDMDKNIHAGVKYMNFMMNDYFKDAGLDETNKCLFAFASYNAGPAKVARLRKEAEECGLDPNKWLQNVELIAAKRIGRETVTYVRNIYKYYVAYKLALAQRASKSEAKKSL